jgi:uncharacterized membrane protein (DUF373 family)
MSSEQNNRPTVTRYVDRAERFVYAGAALLLLATIGMLFYAAGVSIFEVVEKGPLETVLLIFIFAELLNTIGVTIRESEIVAEPFILIGLIAVVRRILAVTVDIEQSLGTPKFDDLILELGVLTMLVLALAAALYFTRRMTRKETGVSDGE